jgi:hypothetical protein
MKQGDKVQYTVTKKVGRGFKISSREGFFEDDLNDGTCKIRTKNGRYVIKSFNFVTPVNQRNALTKMLVGEK